MFNIKEPELVVVGPRYVTVKEVSGTVSMYQSWAQFNQRPDAHDLCTKYLKRIEEQSKLVKHRMGLH